MLTDWQEQKRVDDFCKKVGVQPNDLCYWDVIRETLVGSQKAKALKFNRLKRIIPNFDGTFKVLPISGYNKTTYDLKKDETGGWHCNCQYAVKNPDKECSHIIALALYLKNTGGEGTQ